VFKFEKKPLVISEKEPLIVEKLMVYPSRLQYEDARYNFTDIRHIGWYWQSLTISGVNKQYACLKLYIHGRQYPLTVEESRMFTTPRLVTAYQFIAEKTFQNRLSFYVKQLEQSGRFIYDNCYSSIREF